MHKVKCLYCGESFDRDREPTKQVSARRYAHLKCWEQHRANMSQEEKDIEAFYNYTKELFGEDYNYILTKKLAERYVKENNYTYTGMLKTLKWYYEKQHHSIEKSNGSIGIIPYVYNEALKYYYSLYQAQMKNEEKDYSLYIRPQKKAIQIQSPRTTINKIHFWLEDEG